MKIALLQRARVRKSLHVLATTLGVLLFSVSLFAQGNFGRILGTVTDQTGAVLPGATVTIVDTERGVARTLTTDAAGEYNAPTLIPGNYTVRVEANGFKRLDRQNIVLEVGKEVRVDLTPQPGDQTQTVTVNEAIPLVDAASATLGGTLANAEINDMPLNGRNYQNLLGLRPGVLPQAGGSPWTQSTNGVRPDETVWMVDGIINVNFHDYRPLANSPSPFTDGATILPVDAIQEFNLEENPKAEYGWKPGATVNVGIKSGTNTMHGTAYAFGRYSDWAARNFYDPAGTCPNCKDKLPTELEQFGAVAGGAIKKDKLFYFGGYEGLRSFVGNALGSSVPALGSLGGDPANSMVDAIAALQKAGVTPNPISLKLMGCTTTGANCTGGLIQGAAVNSTTFTSSFPNTNTSDNGIGKMDYNINDKNRINGMVFISHYLANGEDHPVTAAYWQNSNPLNAYTASGNWVYVPSSSVVNEFRFGYNKVHFDLEPDDASKFANGTDYPLNTGVTSAGGFPNLEITGFAGQVLGSWRGRPTVFDTHYYDFQDNVSYLKGKHALKFGFEYAPISDLFNNHDTRGRIQFRGGKTPGVTDCGGSSCPLEDFFAGNPGRAFVLKGTTLRDYTFSSFAWFAQDDWRVTPKLMINLGVRYSFVTPLNEANNLLGNFDPALGMVQEGQPSVGGSLWNTDYKNFSPRLGFAYDVSGKGTTVVRGGFSIIYSMFNPAQFLASSPNNFGGGSLAAVPTGACRTAVIAPATCPPGGTFGGTIDLGSTTLSAANLNWNGPVFPSGGGVICTAKTQCSIMAVDPNYTPPYVYNYNLGVQHAFGSNLSLDVGYVGTHGANLSNFVSLNQIVPAGYGGNGARPFAAQYPYLQFIDQTQNNGRSNYNSLQSTLTKRTSHGLSFTAGYTYAHGLDNGSLSRFGNLPQNSLDPGAEYASGDFDVRHRLTFTGTYALPGKKGFGQMLEGWKLNTIVNLQSSQPWYVNDTGNDFSGSGDTADRWNFYGNPNDFTSGASSIPTCQGFGVTAQGGVDTSKVSCTSLSGVSGLFTTYPSSLAAKCAAVAPDPNTLATGGCFVKGNSVMVPPKAGTYGTMGRNIFRDQGFKSVDFSVFKEWRFKERYGAQFRVELFNLLNHPTVANPYGASNGSGLGIDPSGPNAFGGGGATPDVAAGNPLVGSGSNRVMQLGLKLTF
ncbi:MAG TPA: carboxypeptidase regulatory-like domain-containing protein [Bryobacteraceae bacterium]|nr:carboxypeptidase regulatory-like domain-containing protein [Bryobacteraceae bacterium]